jgi:RimJ/RimL family protein N-acetyltransferase
MCASVLAGIYPGHVFVDNLTQPRSALLTTFIESEAHGVWGFLAGDPANDTFNRALNAAIFNRQVFSGDAPVLLLTCEPQDWGGQLATVLAPRPPIWMPRYHFISRQVGFDWRAALPQGFTVDRMSDALLQMPGLQLPEDVAATLAKWRSLQSERFTDFGFVTLDRTGVQPVIASWATVDFIADGAGDLGFFTQPDYRRRGLGTIAVAAALEHGFASGLQQVNWTCDADNPGSIRTAEKLGLERIADYTMALLLMDEKRHMEMAQQ